MTWLISKFHVGDAVRVRGKNEILATLDKDGCVDGMPFMPEMLQYCGREFVVGQVAHKTCDTVKKTGGRKLRATVHLQGLRCDGASHGGCQAECNLFWKDDWLELATTDRARIVEESPQVGGCDEANLQRLILEDSDNRSEIRYRCQATRLHDASELLPWWNIRQYALDISTGNHTVGRVARILCLAMLRQLLDLPFGYRVWKFVYNTVHRLLTGRDSNLVFGHIAVGKPTPTERLGLEPGELVRVKSQSEIEKTLDKNGLNRGLSFDPEMTPYCGRVLRVRRAVTKIIEEPTGRMIYMKQPCIILEGAVCNAEYSACRLLCPRAIPSYWRELWLERVSVEKAPASAMPQATASKSMVGQP